jgi:hypothetical protein
MERISGHAIDQKHLDGCKPIPLSIGVYIDGYGAKKSADALYERSGIKLREHLRSQPKDEFSPSDRHYANLHTPYGPDICAEIVSFCLALVELHVVAVMEDRYRAAGTRLRPNALIVNQSNPMEIELEGRKHNVIEALFPITEEQLQAKHYLDIACHGTIFAPCKIDRQREISQLTRQLTDAQHRGETARVRWIKRNLETIPKGKFHRRRDDGSIGSSIDFDFVERFYDAVSKRVGSILTLGRTQGALGPRPGGLRREGSGLRPDHARDGRPARRHG